MSTCSTGLILAEATRRCVSCVKLHCFSSNRGLKCVHGALPAAAAGQYACIVYCAHTAALHTRVDIQAVLLVRNARTLRQVTVFMVGMKLSQLFFVKPSEPLRHELALYSWLFSAGDSHHQPECRRRRSCLSQHRLLGARSSRNGRQLPEQAIRT